MPKSILPVDGGEYALVADRIALFYEQFPHGRIVTELVAREDGVVIFRASLYRTVQEREPAATGWALEREGDGDINTVACLENTETSAVGRALANLGFTAARRRPSAEEMQKAQRAREAVRAPARAAVRESEPARGAPRAGARASSRDAADGAQRRERAEALADTLSLLAAAERGGMAAERAAALRAQLTREVLSRAALEHIERGLRRWLAERDAGVLGAPVPQPAARSAAQPAASLSAGGVPLSEQ